MSKANLQAITEHVDECPERGECLEVCPSCVTRADITGACNEVLASVTDRRENGGTQATVRKKALFLIGVLAAGLEG